jgi:hypothetical protein
MPIRPHLNGEQFDQETVRILGVVAASFCARSLEQLAASDANAMKKMRAK